MKDIFEADILCPKCKTKANKKIMLKEGYRIRFFDCPNCSEKIYHPLDLKEYKDFQKLKSREFQVKLRMVGNSFSVTIPREIIDFEEKFQSVEEEVDKIMRLTLEEPGKINLYFRKILEE